jgi:arabinose-5-phosphate isomerase
MVLTMTQPPNPPHSHSPKAPALTPPAAVNGAPAGSSQPALSGREQERRLAERIITAESHAVGQLVGQLGPSFHEAIDKIIACASAGGIVLVSGLGKSGLIGAKISATLTSLGIPSHFVHPTEAAHGDLGSFRKQDICIALSYSGETEELVALAGQLRQDDICVIAITAGVRDSGLRHAASVVLAVGECEDELSPAPMASTTAQLALGDALALCAATRLRFSDEEFARRHPGGALGAMLRPVIDALRFRVSDGTLTPVPDDASVSDALSSSETASRRPGAVILVDRASGRMTGLFTDGDLRRLVLKDPGALSEPIRDHMTRSPGALSQDQLLRDAVRMVREFRRDEIPVVDREGKPVGLLDVQDLITMKLVRD